MPYGVLSQLPTFKDVVPLTCPDYEEFSSVSRCLHISDVQEAERRKMLVPQPIRNSRALGSNTRVLWFAPTQSMEKHNFYGNVSYVINWKTVLDNMGPHLYLIDQAIYAYRAFTRILLTKKNYNGRLQNVNLHSDGSPILERSYKYVHAAQCYCKNMTGHHELQIGIEVTTEDARWLYERCTVMANNHTQANEKMIHQISRNDGKIKEYAPFKCFLYNTTLNALCPYQDSQSKVEATLSSMNIAFSHSLPLDEDMETDKENINHSNRSYPSHAICAVSPNNINPKMNAASSRGIGIVIPSTSQPKTRQHSSPVHNNDGLSQRNSEQYARLRDIHEKWPSTTGTTPDSSNVDRTVYAPRPNKLPPTARTMVDRQHSNICPVTTEPSHIWHSSYRTPLSPTPTFTLGVVPPNTSRARSISTWSRPVTSMVGNDLNPIVGIAITPYGEPVPPKRSFTDRLRRLFMCCCRRLLTKDGKNLSKRHILYFFALCFITKSILSQVREPCTIDASAEGFCSPPLVVSKASYLKSLLCVVFALKSWRPVLSFIRHLSK